MTKEEIYKEMQMPYAELCAYLIQKYGGAVADYFRTPECKSKSKKVSRTSEGLECHHMDEDKGVRLSNCSLAKSQPFEWQKKDRLVYCNILEHLILHFKIAVLRQKDRLRKPNEVSDFFTSGGIFMICSDINDMFMKDGTAVAWRKRCFEEISDNYNDYILLLKSLLLYIDQNYIGEKSAFPFLVPGSVVHFSDCDCEILKVTKKKDGVLLKMPSGEEKAYRSSVAHLQLTYLDYVDTIKREMSCGYDVLYSQIFDSLTNAYDENILSECSQALKVDFNGHGFPQYSSIELSEDFGSKNADEYISKALPMFSEYNLDLRGKTPIFFKGPYIPEEVGNSFYIVRVKTLFRIKEGEEAFVRCRQARGIDILTKGFSTQITDTSNLRDRGWTVMESTDVYDEKTGKMVIDSQKKIAKEYATVKLSLGRPDYLLFLCRYNIYYFELLDGCYFN